MEIVGTKLFDEYLRNNEIPKVFLIYGDDSYNITRYKNKILKLCDVPYPEFNLLQVDGRVSQDMGTLQDFTLSIPFMNDRKILVIDDLDISKDKIDKTNFEKLEALLDNLMPCVTVIITVRTVEFSIKKGETARAKKIISLCDKNGICCQMNTPTRSDFVRIISNTAIKKGTRISSADANLLADYCENDLVRALNELEKLTFYVGNGDITKDAINLLVAPVINANVFNMCDKLLQKNLGSALSELQNLYFYKQTPESISYVLSMTLSDLYKVALAKKSGKTKDETCKDLGYFGGTAYRITKLWNMTNNIPADKLFKAIEKNIEFDSKMKTGGTNSEILMETLLTEIYIIFTEAEQKWR